MSGGLLEVNSSGIVVLAFAGNVPVTALVSRGCVPVSEEYKITEAGCYILVGVIYVHACSTPF